MWKWQREMPGVSSDQQRQSWACWRKMKPEGCRLHKSTSTRGSGLCSRARRGLYYGDKVKSPCEAVSPSLEPSLRLQSRWFLVSSKPGRHSQAMPPLGVSRQMWAQPWFLFMQFIPSKRQKEAKKSSKSSLAPVCGGRRMSGVGWRWGDGGNEGKTLQVGTRWGQDNLEGQHLWKVDKATPEL